MKIPHYIHKHLLTIALCFFIMGLYPVITAEGNKKHNTVEMTAGLTFSPLITYREIHSFNKESHYDVDIHTRSWSFISIIIAILLLMFRSEKYRSDTKR